MLKKVTFLNKNKNEFLMDCPTINNIKYCVVNEVFMVGTNITGLNPNAASRTLSGVVEIPEIVDNRAITAIGAAAFSRCEKITHVIIKAKIKIIYERAFADCSSLSYINIPTTVEEIHNLAIHSYNYTGHTFNQSTISSGIIVVVFEPHSSIKFVGSNNFDKKSRVALHFSEPIYPKLGSAIFKDVAHPSVVCPVYFKFNGVPSRARACSICRKAYSSRISPMITMLSSILC